MVHHASHASTTTVTSHSCPARSRQWQRRKQKKAPCLTPGQTRGCSLGQPDPVKGTAAGSGRSPELTVHGAQTPTAARKGVSVGAG